MGIQSLQAAYQACITASATEEAARLVCAHDVGVGT